MILKYLFVVSLFLKCSKCAIFLEENKASSTCDKIVEENQKNLQRISENFENFTKKLKSKKLVDENQNILKRISNLEKSSNKLETTEEHFKKTLIEENQKILQRISNLEISSNKLEAKEEYLRKTLIEEDQKIWQKISNLEISSNKLEGKKENLITTENTKILLNISDILDVSNKKLEAKEEYVSKVFEALDESIKKTMQIAVDESVESFLIKNHLLLYQMMKEMITRQQISSTITVSKESTDCSDLFLAGATESGFYFIHPFKCRCTKPVKVYCDMKTDGGGWTVFLQRNSTSNPVNFTRNWESYKKGFGNEEEFWLGNEALHTMTVNKNYALRMEAKASEGEEIWGVWNYIVVLSEDEKYKLVVTGHDEKSTAYDRFDYHTDNFFSTYDMDNDKNDHQNCAKEWRGGWWFNYCAYINPAGEHGRTGKDGLLFIPWSKTDNENRHATWVQLKIRPLV